jgi:hypothetical protein
MPVPIGDRTIAFWAVVLLAAGGALTTGAESEEAEECYEGVQAYVQATFQKM